MMTVRAGVVQIARFWKVIARRLSDQIATSHSAESG
jgi:hypothetical protein